MDLYADKEYVCTQIPYESRVSMFNDTTDFVLMRGGHATWLDIRLAWDRDVPVSEVMRNRLDLAARDRRVHGLAGHGLADEEAAS
jgi:hypothetical protein